MTGITRRAFVAGSALLAATAAGSFVALADERKDVDASASRDGMAGSAASSADASASSDARHVELVGDGVSDIGDAKVWIATPGGTSEDGNIPKVAAMENAMTSFDLYYEGGDGSIATVYVDGKEAATLNIGQMGSSQFPVEGEDLSEEGEHYVEVLAGDVDNPTLYKVMRYEVEKSAASGLSGDGQIGDGTSDIGDATVYINTPGGSSENGNIPKVAAIENGLESFDLYYEGGDGTPATVYVDGQEVETINVGQMGMTQFYVSADQISEKGEHIVEVIAGDPESPTLYKFMRYEVQ